MNIQLNDPAFQEKIRVREALCQVLDPELMVNIVELGLLYNVEVTDDTVTITMTLTSRGCPLGEAIQQGIKNALRGLILGRKVEVVVVWEPQWTFEDISDAGRAQLGF